MTEQDFKELIKSDPEFRYELFCEILKFCVTCGAELDRRGLICTQCFYDGYVPLPWVEREALRLQREVRERELRDVTGGK